MGSRSERPGRIGYGRRGCPTLAGLVVTYLFIGRFRRSGHSDELVLSFGLVLLAPSNLLFAALAATFGFGSIQAIA